VVAALARGVSKIERPLEADDTEAMRDGLRALGVSIEDNDDPWLVVGNSGHLRAADIDARQSGTTARFLGAVAALVSGRVEINGQGRLPARPFSELADALNTVGAPASLHGGGLPLVIDGRGEIPGGLIPVDPSRSSQFVTALLLVAPLARSRVEIAMTAPPVSRSYLDSTLEVMRAFGAEVDALDQGYVVEPTGYVATSYEIEADASAAAYLLVAAAITGGTVAVDGIPERSTQPDLGLVPVLEAMGCRVKRFSNRLELTGTKDLRSVDVEMDRSPDAVLALAVACLFAQGTSRLRCVANLRLKESDRLGALVSEIERVGGDATVSDDTLTIEGGKPLRPALIDSHGDHRMAMAMALVGLRQPGIDIGDPEVVAKTWPNYFSVLDRL
jgi:3-phosphoshikimate 1-carboxyvinyltransferase